MKTSCAIRFILLTVILAFISIQGKAQCTVEAGVNVSICRFESANLNAVASGGTAPYDYSWSPAIGLSSTTISNPAASPFMTTNYTVTITDDAGCTASDVVTVTVRSLPNANAGNNITLCPGTGTAIGGSPTASGGTSPYNYSWSPATGLNAVNISNPTASPASNTTYVVTVTDANGCTDSDNVLVSLYPAPVAAFSFGPDNQCSGTTVSFTNSSAGSGLSYAWNFGDPASGASNTSTQQNPVHVFNTTGCGTQTYTVILTVTDVNGCIDTVQHTVSVLQRPDPVLTDADVISPFSNCDNNPSPSNPNFSLTLNNATANSGCITSYTIDWGDGNISTGLTNADFPITHNYTQLGAFDLVFTAFGSNGCQATMNYTVANQSNPAVGVTSLGGTTGCAPQTFKFIVSGYTNNSPGTYYVIDYGDGTAPSTLSHAALVANDTILHTYATSSCGAGLPGNQFSVTVTAYNACSNTPATVSAIKVYSTPVAGFTHNPTNGCTTTNMCFVNQTIPGYGFNCSTTTAYSWTFGDGGTSAATSPCHLYATPGTYAVTLSATNYCGTTYYSDSVCINAPPVSLFSLNATTGCAPFSVSATNLSNTLNTCGTTTYTWAVIYVSSVCAPTPGSWSFTGGTNANSINPSFIFNNPGTYTIRLTVQNACTTVQSSQNIIVKTVPAITMNAVANICGGGTVNPTATFNNCYGTISAYNWTFPGGSPGSASTQVPGAVIYSTPGPYTINLSATNECGTTNASTSFTVYPLPVANAGVPKTVCSGTAVALGGSPTASGGTPGYSYQWSSSPAGFSSTAANPTATPSVTTTYTVTVTDSRGCKGTSTVTVTVNPRPTVTVNSTAICNGSSATLNATVSGGTPPYTYQWSNSANTSGITVSPVITTTYVVTVTDSSSTGCSATASGTVTVRPNPSVTVNNPAICQGASVNLTATGSGTTAPYSYSWSSGQLVQTISVSPPSTTTYTVTVTDNSSTHCTNSTTAVVTVNPRPVVSVTPDTVCKGTTAVLTATASGATTPYTYLWNTAATTPSISVTPASTTNYTVTVTDASTTHCTGTAIGNVLVMPVPVVTIANQAVCIGDTATLTASATGGTAPYSWIWNTGDTLNSITESPAVTTVYTVTATESSFSNCNGTATGTLTIYPLPVVNAGSDQVLCDQMIPYTLTGYSPAGGSWSGPGVTAGGVFTPGAVGVGSYTLTYTYTNVNGCTNSDSVVMTVVGAAIASAGTDTAVCLNSGAFSLTGSPAGGTWSGSALVTPAGLFTPSSAGIFTLTYSYGTGTCLSTDSKIIQVYALPVVSAGTAQSVCIDAAPFNLTGASPAGGTWTGTGIVDGVMGTFDPSVAGSGTFTVTYSYTDPVTGCTNSSGKNITVNPLPVVNAGTDQVLCNQMIPYTLTGYSPAGGTWTGTGVTPAGVFTPGTAGAGTHTLVYTYTNANGCVNRDSVVMTVVNPTLANAGNDTAVCVNSTAFTCIATPAGGTWSGSALITPAGLFTPSASGTYNLTYTFGTGTCLTTDIKTIVVNALPVVAAGTAQTVCIDALPFNLAGASPAGGNWSGTGITNAALGTFNPAVAGAGTHTVIYTYTDPATGCTNTASKNITVNPLPAVNAGADQLLCNQMIPYTLTGYTPAGGTWSGPGVTVAGVFTPGLVGPGTFTLVYSYTNANSCTNHDSVVMTVVNPAVANAGSDTAVCINSGQFQCVGSPAGGTWSGSALVTPLGIFVPSSAGTFNLTYTYGTGTCLTSDSKTIVVNDLPVVSAGNNQAVCIDVSPFMIAGATPAGGIWTGAGITDTLTGTFDPATAGAGSYVLTYHYTDPLTHCSQSSSLSMTVNPLPVAAFSFDTLVCENAPVTFLNLSSGANSYAWDFGDGAVSTLVNPSHSFGAEGYYNVTLISASVAGCTDTLTKVIHVIAPPVAIFSLSPPSGCGPLNVSFTNTSTGTYADYSWNFGNGLTDTVQHPADVQYQMVLYVDTTYYVIMSVSNMCGTSTATDSVRITYPPHADFGTNVSSGCSTVSVSFSNITTGLPQSFWWDFGDGTTGTTSQTTFSHSYTAGQNDTTYTITLIAYNVCGSDTMTHSILVQPNPINAFFNTSIDHGCAPLTVNFSNYSTGNGITNNNYWSFGDGNISSQYSPTHVFTLPGTYVVSLAVNNVCSYDTAYATITVFPFPVVNFSVNPSTICVGQAVPIVNNSLNITNTEWDFGDGYTSNLFNPVHSYPGPGTYQITLVGTSFDGCIDSITRTVTVLSLPIVNAGADQIFCVNNAPAQLTGFTPAGGSWSGPGVSTSGLFTPASVGAGVFNLIYTYTGPNGCSNSDTIQVDVILQPVANAGNDRTICVSEMQTQLTGSPAGGTWSGLFTTPSGVFTVPVAGDYALVYTYGPPNCIAHDTMIMTVTPLPVVDAGENVSVCLDATPFNLSGSPAGGFWSGPGITNAAQGLFNPGVTDTGTFVVTYTYTDPATQCENTDSMAVTVTPMPQPDITASALSGCQPLTVYFLNETQYASDYLWVFGDGDSSTAVSPTHIYDESGQYTVTLYANSVLGCGVSTTLNITVHPIPVADIGLDPLDGCVPFTITFPNVSIFGDTYSWDFGDGGTSTLANPTHTYYSPGTFSVTLTVTSVNGCVNVQNNPDLILVHPQPQAGFFPDPYTTSIAESIIQFVDQSVDAGSWNWYFGDGSFSNLQFPSHTYTDTGYYFVEQFVANEWGCSDSASAYVRISDFFTFYAPNAFSPNGDGINESFLVKGTGIDPNNFTMYIYDRWGKMLFRTCDIEEGWDGTTNDSEKIQPEGVYTYLIFVGDNNNILHKYTGTVTLVH